MALSFLFFLFLFAQQPDAPTPTAAANLPALRHAIDTGHAATVLPELDKLAASPAVNRAVLGQVQALRGQAFYAEGSMAEAEKAFARALAADPQSTEAAQMRGIALFRLGKPAEAIPLLEASTGGTQAGATDPSYVLALCYVDTRRYEDARRAFARQYGFAPDGAQAYLLAARFLLRRELLSTAQEFAAKALTLDPQLPLAHALLGEVALAGNHLDEAAREFEAERQRNPLEPSVYDRLGDAYSRAGDYPRAQRMLEQAVLLEPNATGPYILLGKVLLKQGDAVAATRYLEHARQLDPRNAMTHNLLAQAYRAEGRRSEAAAENEAGVRIESGSGLKLSNVQ